MPYTMQDKFCMILELRGSKPVPDAKTRKYKVLTRDGGGFYYVGKSGSLRIGRTSTSSVPANSKFKHMLLEMFDNWHQTGFKPPTACPRQADR